MTGFFKGLCLGAALATATLVGYAYGEQSESSDEIHPDLVQCQVDVGYGHPSFSDQCSFNEVMVGTRGDHILCADVRVSCP